jgi:hypothetical protein
VTSPFPSYTPHVPAKPKTLSRQKCGISSALDGSEDDILYEESDASSENSHEDYFSGIDDDFLRFYDE